MSETVTLAGFVAIAVAALALQFTPLLGRRTATLADALASVTARRVPRLLFLAGWLWLGWHLFARAGAE